MYSQQIIDKTKKKTKSAEHNFIKLSCNACNMGRVGGRQMSIFC